MLWPLARVTRTVPVSAARLPKASKVSKMPRIRCAGIASDKHRDRHPAPSDAGAEAAAIALWRSILLA